MEGEGRQGAFPQGKHKMPPHPSLTNTALRYINDGHELCRYEGSGGGGGIPLSHGKCDEQ